MSTHIEDHLNRLVGMVLNCILIYGRESSMCYHTEVKNNRHRIKDILREEMRGSLLTSE
jgi:hypothetical protein